MGIKSPLRYPGGKSRAVKLISKILPEHFTEYREPFLGGGSVFLFVKQKFPELKFWINDINTDLYLFWFYLQKDAHLLSKEILKIKKETTDGLGLFNSLRIKKLKNFSDFERAVRFYILNKISFSGVVDSGGFSKDAFETRFTEKGINNLVNYEKLLENVKITNLDYRYLIVDGDKNVFTFFDPPYLRTSKFRLYGKNGILHLTFKHKDFRTAIEKCNHTWLITYDNSDVLIDAYKEYNIYKWYLQYGMNNYKQEKAKLGEELFISNYELKNEALIPVKGE